MPASITKLLCYHFYKTTYEKKGRKYTTVAHYDDVLVNETVLFCQREVFVSKIMVISRVASVCKLVKMCFFYVYDDMCVWYLFMYNLFRNGYNFFTRIVPYWGGPV